jgi:hypothetical protein
MTDNELLELGRLIENQVKCAEHDRLVVRFFDKEKLSAKEIDRRMNNTMNGLNRSYGKTTIGKRFETEQYLIFVCLALREGLEMIEVKEDAQC